jgi:hypothetical protein
MLFNAKMMVECEGFHLLFTKQFLYLAVHGGTALRPRSTGRSGKDYFGAMFIV